MFETRVDSIVVIVGSAGSLTPLMQILAPQPQASAAIFLVLIHRSTTPPFYLDSVLGSACRLPVSFANHEEPLLPGHVYIAPAGEKHLVVEGRCSRLVPGDPVNFQRPAADPLFRSIAACECRKIAVMLSGAGHNGVKGLDAIKAAGGYVLVQEPSEAEFSDMPRNALAAVTPDLCAPAAELGEWLARNASADSLAG